MLEKLKNVLALAFTTPAPKPIAPTAADRKSSVATLAVATLIGTWLFAYKVRDFVGLGTTSDLYNFVQLCTTWPGKGFLVDSYYGQHLALHAYLICPLLGVLAQPFGAYGLFLALALAGAFGFLAAVRLLTMFEVPRSLALAFAVLITAMPLSVHTFQDTIYGFHVDLLEPAIALWLAYHLFRRAWIWSIVCALALILIKEDAPLLAMAVASTVLGEDLVRGWFTRDGSPRRRIQGSPAIAILGMSALAIPLLLYLISTQQTTGKPANLARVTVLDGMGVGTNSELVNFALANVGNWLGSDAVAKWRSLIIIATFGLGILRPHLVVLGLVSTVAAWLMQDDLLWASRFVQSLALFQLGGCLGCASAWRLVNAAKASPHGGRWFVGGITMLCAIAAMWSVHAQFVLLPDTDQFYRLSPKLGIPTLERQLADRLFAVYRAESRREEPVVATYDLFRYAHDRNLIWPEKLKRSPTPVWVLWDTEKIPVMGLWTFLKRDAGVDFAAFELRGRDGRFILLKRRTGPQPVPTLDTGIPAIAGEPAGAIRLRLKFSTGQVGHSEPLVSLGDHERGDVFQVSYESANQITLRVERIGAEIYSSAPIDLDPAVEHEIELFSGGLYPTKTGPEPLPVASQRAYYESQLRIAFDGREVLRKTTPQRTGWLGEPTIGINHARASSTELAFTGSILSAHRGGFPAMPGATDAAFGAVRMRLVLPAAAAGTPEPLLVMGQPGAAILAFVRVLPQGKIKLGAEVWGVGAFESGEIAADSRTPIEVVFAWPTLFPAVGDKRWGEVTASRQQQASAELTLRVDNQTVLTQPIKRRAWPSSELSFGKNPVGGSLVGEAFTGEILWVLREPLTAP